MNKNITIDLNMTFFVHKFVNDYNLFSFGLKPLLFFWLNIEILFK